MKLNDEQLKAVKHGPFPLLILAGAGTGKTTTILSRIQHIANDTSIAPESILALTFSVEATENLKKKLLEQNIPNSDLINVSNFHSFAKILIEDNYQKLGYSSVPVIIEKDDLVYLFLNKIDSFSPFNSRRYNRFPIKAIKSLLSIHDQFCQELISKDRLIEIKDDCLNRLTSTSDEEDEVYRQIIDSVDTFEDFRRIKKESGFIEYEDMIYDVWNLLTMESKVLLDLQDKYKFIIIDEFQDNNYAFSEIINQIAIHHQNITIVGDDDQSIYSFRGANSYNMHDFHNLYSKNPNYKKIELVENYRSRQEILDIANSVIINNDNRMDKKALNSSVDTSNTGLVELHVGDFSSQLSEIVQKIKNIVEKNKRNNTIAILCRTHSDCSFVAQVLDDNHILHSYSNSKLFEQSIVKDIIGAINIAACSKYALHSMIRLSRDKFSKKFINTLIDIEKNEESLLETCIANRKHFNNSEYEWICNLKKILNGYGAIDNFVDNLVRFIKKDDFSKFEICLIDQIKDIFKKFNNFYRTNNVQSLCKYINLMMDNNTHIVHVENEPIEGVINLMTVHNSKGMEFDFVFLPFLQSSKFPQANRKIDFATDLPLEFKIWSMDALDEKACHIEEERRLFYVAVTRAKERLYLLSTDKRRSKFLGEIDKDLYDCKMIEEGALVDAKKELHSETYSFDKLNQEDLIYLSSSRINNYNKCQLLYKYSNLDAIPGFRYNSIFTLGNVVHKVLQEFHENNLNGFDSLIEILDKNWNGIFYAYSCESEQYYQDAKHMLSNYASYLDGNPASPILFEHYFKINMKKCILSGVIDRVDVDDDGRLIIYDYKTSKTQKKPTQLKKDFQLPIYALAVYYEGSKMHDKIKNDYSSIFAGELSLRFKKPEQVVEFDIEEIEEFENSINELAEDISSSIFLANPSFMNCAYCDYKKFICSYYN